MVVSHPALSARVMKSVSMGVHRMAAALVVAKAQRPRTRLNDGLYKRLFGVMCRTLVQSFPRFSVTASRWSRCRFCALDRATSAWIFASEGF
jgi:hypothetical protein